MMYDAFNACLPTWDKIIDRNEYICMWIVCCAVLYTVNDLRRLNT